MVIICLGKSCFLAMPLSLTLNFCPILSTVNQVHNITLP